MWKLFLERMLSVVDDGGMLAVVLPSGILTNAGATELRKALLNMQILKIYANLKTGKEKSSKKCDSSDINSYSS